MGIVSNAACSLMLNAVFVYGACPSAKMQLWWWGAVKLVLGEAVYSYNIISFISRGTASEFNCGSKWTTNLLDSSSLEE